MSNILKKSLLQDEGIQNLWLDIKWWIICLLLIISLTFNLATIMMLRSRVTRSMARRLNTDRVQTSALDPINLNTGNISMETFSPSNGDILQACRDLFKLLEASSLSHSQNLVDLYKQLREFNRQLAGLTGKNIPLTHLLHERRGRSPPAGRRGPADPGHGQERGATGGVGSGGSNEEARGVHLED